MISGRVNRRYLMEKVADVQLSFYEALILRADGTLWAWLRNGTEPQPVAENVRTDGALCLFHDGEEVVLDTHVLEAGFCVSANRRSDFYTATPSAQWYSVLPLRVT